MKPYRYGATLVLTFAMGMACCAQALCADALADLPDPTRPGAGDGSAANVRPRWVLQSTLISPQRRVAIIDGQRVTIGAILNGARIIDIRLREVDIQRGKRMETLRILPMQAVISSSRGGNP